MKKTQANLDRLKQIKTRLIARFEDVLIWLEGVHSNWFYEQLFDYSIEAAELAAILGYPQPPFEHVGSSYVRRDGRCEDLLELNAHSRVIHAQSPSGDHTSLQIDATMSGELLRTWFPCYYEDLRQSLMPWMHSLSRIDLQAIAFPSRLFAPGIQSIEAEVFELQRLREQRGDSRSYGLEFLTKLAEAANPACLDVISPQETAELHRALGRSWENTRGSQRTESEAQVETVSRCRGGARGMSVTTANAKAAEIIALDGYRGLRRLATRVGCSHETLRKCAAVQPHLKPKPKIAGDSRDVSEVDVADASAADPLELLVEQEELEIILNTLEPEGRSAVLEMTPQEQRELLKTWQAQQRDKHEDGRPKSTRRRRVV